MDIKALDWQQQTTNRKLQVLYLVLLPSYLSTAKLLSDESSTLVLRGSVVWVLEVLSVDTVSVGSVANTVAL
jgi:hypothetical protein